MRSTKNKIIVILSILFLLSVVMGYLGSTEVSIRDVNTEVIPSEDSMVMPEMDTEVGALRVI